MRRPVAIALLLASLTPPSVWGGEVIVNESVSISADEIRDVFLGEKQLAAGVHLVPVDNAAAQGEFLSRMLQTDAAKYYARWTRKSFREGLSAPSLKGSDAEVIAFVKATPGAVGYVTKATRGLKVVATF
jgi:hypothetical protein